MKVSMLLAESASVKLDQLFIMAGGWTEMADPVPHALVAMVQTIGKPIDWELNISAYLLNSDGDGVIQQNNADSFGPIRISLDATIGASAPVSMMIPFVMNFYPLPLAPNRDYTWCVDINDEHQDDWELTFHTADSYPNLEIFT